MNKKLLAAAVAATVVAAPAAFAESTIYGKFHTSIDMVDNATNDNWQMNSNASRLGFKGSEDLGNGLKAIYQAEFTVSTDGGAGQAGGNGWGGQRNTFIGLAGDWGTFLVGRHDVPAKMAWYAQGNELLGDSIIDLNSGNTLVRANNTNLGVFHEYRANNAIAYVSPNFSGFTFAAAAVPGEDPIANPADRDGLADHYSLGVMWKGMGFKAGVGYNKYDLGTGDDMKVLQVGGSYTFGAFSVGASYEDTTDDAGAKGADYTAWGVTGKATFGNNAISVAYVDADRDAASAGATLLNPAYGADFEKDGWGISAEHNFSKRTSVYAAYAASSIDEPSGTEDDDRFSLGMIHNF